MVGMCNPPGSTVEWGRSMKIMVLGYRIRNPEREDEVYAEGIDDRGAAFVRAQELADFYRHPVEVVQVVGGVVSRRVGDVVEPTRMAPRDDD